MNYSLFIRHITLLALFIGFPVIGYSQIINPISWELSIENETEKEATLILKAILDEHWHIYALSEKVEEVEGGPILTSITYKESSSYKLLGKIEAPHTKKEYSPQFEMNLEFFEGNAIFKQKIKKNSSHPFRIDGSVEYMACDEQQCLPPKTFRFQYLLNASSEDEDIIVENVKSETKNPNKKSSQGSLIRIFILGFLGGLAALFTPCVFPMIPLTVSFFTKQSEKRSYGWKGVSFYMLSIIIIYVGLGVGITSLFGASSLNALSTSVYFNLFFFLLLLIFAASFLGAFNINLPSSWLNAIDKKSASNSNMSVFFMAFSLALVSFSCTGPIIGTLLVDAAVHGDIMGPVLGMFGFSFALSLPFGLFALFPHWLKTLPKSGGWLNSMKVTLGFLELAFSLKFLSNVDLVLNLHMLEREVFIAFWVIIFGLLGLYLLGKIRLPHDSKLEYIPIPRFLLAIITLSFTLYLLPGVWGGAPLHLISGFPPPTTYSEVHNSRAASVIQQTSQGTNIKPSKYKKLGPYGITLFLDYKTGIDYAKKVNKPVFLDFTGHACVNCRKIEDYVWSAPKVTELLKNKVVVISLYVDDKRPLAKRYLSEYTNEWVETIGEKWSEFQTYKYGANAQPYYVIVDHNGKPLIQPLAYERDVDAYYQWLLKGIAAYRAKSVR